MLRCAHTDHPILVQVSKYTKGILKRFLQYICDIRSDALLSDEIQQESLVTPVVMITEHPGPSSESAIYSTRPT